MPASPSLPLAGHPPLSTPPRSTMFTSMHVSKTLALRPEGPSYDAHVEGEKERQKNVTR